MNNTRENYRPNRPTRQVLGGQHRAPAGLTTLDSQTDDERIEHVRRLNIELAADIDEAALRACYFVDWEVRKFGVVCGVEW